MHIYIHIRSVDELATGLKLTGRDSKTSSRMAKDKCNGCMFFQIDRQVGVSDDDPCMRGWRWKYANTPAMPKHRWNEEKQQIVT